MTDLTAANTNTALVNGLHVEPGAAASAFVVAYPTRADHWVLQFPAARRAEVKAAASRSTARLLAVPSVVEGVAEVGVVMMTDLSFERFRARHPQMLAFLLSSKLRKALA